MSRAPEEVVVPTRPRLVVAGAVVSTRRILECLLRHEANVVGVLGLEAAAAPRTSGYRRLDDLADAAGIPYADFRNVNDPESVALLRRWEPDLLFAVGLSQLVRREVLDLPRLGCVGFHPTWLPEGRGRAPLAWLTWEARPGAATFFLIDEGMDSGPIFAQEPFHVAPSDYAEDVEAKQLAAIDRALDRWIPRLITGHWDPVPQDDRQATYYGRRAPEDGLIDWSWPAERIHALVRAASRPHPGAYTHLKARKLIVWRAEPERALRWSGVAGRVLLTDAQKGALVATGDGLLWLAEVEDADAATANPQGTAGLLKVGVRLGYAPQDEIHRLRRQVIELQARLEQLEHSMGRSSALSNLD
jgi:methionyl-tRNA formyltransferase